MKQYAKSQGVKATVVKTSICLPLSLVPTDGLTAPETLSPTHKGMMTGVRSYTDGCLRGSHKFQESIIVAIKVAIDQYRLRVLL